MNDFFVLARPNAPDPNRPQAAFQAAVPRWWISENGWVERGGGRTTFF